MTSPIYINIQSKLQELQSSLLERHPRMPVMLREIHSLLKQNPEVVTLMSEEEVAIVIAGLSEQTKTHLAGSVMKSAKSASATKALKTVKTDDLGF